eukprot:11207027-Lingulodinium_polyedra.AAC.1
MAGAAQHRLPEVIGTPPCATFASANARRSANPRGETGNMAGPAWPARSTATPHLFSTTVGARARAKLRPRRLR